MSACPFILAIEISNPGAQEKPSDADGGGPGIALGRMESRSIGSVDFEPIRPSGRGGQDDDLMPAIDRLCRRVGMDPRSRALARVAVSIGPGGYTSVRVACAVGKMIAEACGAKCVGVPTASVVLESVPQEVRSATVAVALASKNDSAWIQPFSDGVELVPGRLMTAADIPDLLAIGVRVLVGDRFLPVSMRSAAEGVGIRIQEPVFDAAACARLGARLPTIDPVELVPFYPREPDAVTLWRAKKST